MHIETSSYTDVASIRHLFKRIGEEIVRRRRFTTRLGNRLSRAEWNLIIKNCVYRNNISNYSNNLIYKLDISNKG